MMNSGGFRKGTAGLICMVLLACLVFAGCDDGSSGSDGTVKGVVSGVSATGASVELMTPDGTVVASRAGAVKNDGSFSLGHDKLDRAEPYHILQVDLNGRTLRALLVGHPGADAYLGPDTVVSPYTEAAYLTADVTGAFRMKDYADYLKCVEAGKYDSTSPESFAYPFREVIDEVAEMVSEYFAGVAESKPDATVINDLVETDSHQLSPDLPGEGEEVARVTRVLVTPDRSANLFLSYDPQGSTIDSANPIRIDTPESGQDGVFQWTGYTIRLGANDLSDMSVELADGSTVAKRRDTAVVAYTAKDGARGLTSEGATVKSATGDVTVTTSNTGQYVDADASGIVADKDKTTGHFNLAFTREVNSTSLTIEFDLSPHSGFGSTLETIPLGQGSSFQSKDVDLNATDVRDNRFIACIKSGIFSLFAVSDAVDFTRYQPTSPMVAYRTMAQTRANATSILNNFVDSNDVQLQPLVCGNTYSHYIVDVDRLMSAGAVEGWGNTTYGKAPPGDDGRIPLVLVHGWQGDKGYRSAAKLCYWAMSPIQYFYNFISFYQAKESLHSKYHLYAMRWPSYKHLTYNGEMFADMLDEIKTTHPDSDLARGMSDSSIGVAFITHSTGGLITRSAIELHGATSDGADAGAHLRGAILIASPNHGTAEATNIAPNNVAMDVDTQGTTDLEWDSFDGRADLFMAPRDYSYLTDRTSSRWVAARQDVKAFDMTYLDLLGDVKTETYNPWLLWFSRNFFARTDTLHDKYTLYSGWSRAALESGNYINNTFKFGAAGVDLGLTGYMNDSVLPVASNLFAKSAEAEGFYLPNTLKYFPMDQWYPTSELWDVDNGTVLVQGAAADHPLKMDFRLLWDYAHMQTIDGAFHGSKEATVAELIELGDVVATSYATHWWHEAKRRDYIRGALKLTTGADPGPITDYRNPLTFDPVFLFLEKDLTDLAM